MDYVKTIMNLNFMTVNLKIFSIISFCLIPSVPSEDIPYEVDYTGISTAIAQVCNEFFIKKSTIFDILIYGEMTQHIRDVTSKFIEILSIQVPINIQFIHNMTAFDHKLTRSAVIFFRTD
ncbi:hypothetical protein ACKWTF_014555 [Chironomus riparius]